MKRLKSNAPHSLLVTCLLAVALLMGSCKNDDDPDAYDIPSTYSFENVDFSGQTTRMDMLTEMVTLMKTGNTPGTAVDAQALQNMYRNENSPFQSADLNASTKQLKNKCFSLDADLFESYFDSLALISNSQTPGSMGVAGVVTSPDDPTKAYLLSAKGMEYTQIIEKGLMGAILYYQITGVYFSEDKIGPAVDNTTVTPGQGTPMEHHWDEAFGYLGVPTDFPANTTGIRFIGKYCHARDPIMGTNAIMEAYRTGRAAISHDDMDTKNEQVVLIREYLEEIFAATAIHYINEARANFADDAIRCHALSEAIGFISGLKYNPTARITQNQIDSYLDRMGDDLYFVSIADLDAVRSEIATFFGFTTFVDQL